MRRAGAKGIDTGPIDRTIQDAASELPRILLLSTWVNKGKEKGRAAVPWRGVKGQAQPNNDIVILGLIPVYTAKA
jgi:hypothetical protein